MPTPKRKVSKARRDKRSANKGIKYRAAITCQTCNEPILPHQVCAECGHYKGMKVLRTKKDRMYARAKDREATETKKRARDAVEEKPEAKEDPK